MVEDLAKREEVFQTRTLFATEQRKRYEELEVVVKSYTDKENLGNKVKLLQQRREWANVAELKEQVEVTTETPQKNRNFILVAIKRQSCKTVYCIIFMAVLIVSKIHHTYDLFFRNVKPVETNVPRNLQPLKQSVESLQAELM